MIIIPNITTTTTSNTYCINLSLQLGQKPAYINPSTRSLGSSIELILFYILIALILLDLIIFMLAKLVVYKSSKRLQVRSLLSPFSTHLGLLFCMLNSLYFYASVLESVPCWFEKFSMFLIAPLVGLPFAAQLSIFSNNYRVHSSMAKAVKAQRPVFFTSNGRRSSSLRRFGSRNHGTTANGTGTAGGGGSIPSTTNNLTSGASAISNTTTAARQATSNASSINLTPRTSLISLMEDPCLMNLLFKMISCIGTRPSTSRLLSILLFPYLLTSIVVTAINPMVHAGCWGCQDTYTEYALQLTGFIVTFITVCVALLLVRGIPDPFQICREIKTGLWIALITIIAYICTVFQGNKPGQDWNWDIIVNISLYAVCFVTTIMQVIIVAIRVNYKKKRSFSLGNGSPGNNNNTTTTLANGGANNKNNSSTPHPPRRPSSSLLSRRSAIINFDPSYVTVERFLDVYPPDTKPYEAFERALINEQGVESLCFYEECLTWKRAYEEMARTVAKNWARQICELFLLDSSPYEVNISGPTKQTILENVFGGQQQTGTTIMNMNEDTFMFVFDQAMREISQLMNDDSFARFKVSEDWRKLIRHGDLSGATLLVNTSPQLLQQQQRNQYQDNSSNISPPTSPLMGGNHHHHHSATNNKSSNGNTPILNKSVNYQDNFLITNYDDGGSEDGVVLLQQQQQQQSSPKQQSPPKQQQQPSQQIDNGNHSNNGQQQEQSQQTNQWLAHI
jgi:hypothetical protein